MGDCENTTNLSQGHLTSFVLLYSHNWYISSTIIGDLLNLNH